MKLAITVLYLALMYAFVGAVAGIFLGFGLVAFGAISVEHIVWVIEVCAALFVAFGLLCGTEGGSGEYYSPRTKKKKLHWTRRPDQLFDEGPFWTIY